MLLALIKQTVYYVAASWNITLLDFKLVCAKLVVLILQRSKKGLTFQRFRAQQSMFSACHCRHDLALTISGVSGLLLLNIEDVFSCP